MATILKYENGLLVPVQKPSRALREKEASANHNDGRDKHPKFTSKLSQAFVGVNTFLSLTGLIAKM